MTDAAPPASGDPRSTLPNAASPLPETGWAKLGNRVLVRISGPGTDKFLQGQFSQNLDEVVAGYSPRAAAATPKGRAYCLTRVVRDGDDIVMDLDSALAESTLGQLRKYLMLFRGTSADPVTDGCIFGLFGDSDAQRLAGQALSELKKPGDSLALDSGYLIRVEPTAEGLSRFELWHTAGKAPALDASEERSLADWQASEIAAGIAALTAQTLEAFVPQMLNWQHVGGIHFKKGCYTGQEVIARMHFLGQLKKSLYRFQLDTADAPEPGRSILAGDRSVGSVVNSVPLKNGTCELLAVVRHDAADADLTVDGLAGQTLTPLPLPYAVPEREKSPQTDT
ncbi:CAF17-like 4Fe-4S cluster assembly/insertion protein YgfZ [Marinobacter sp. F4206]|uniref:CAF17-like 4Fe-4S cluster assembly/insertion protein YgfZ n=1 Tax=Marinobacter sp. F4206 TaxID=2861777 RepID=UPI001C5CFAA2|nr:folate-binding protein [Marinobacter sp. F4206]MBW4935776.1 folate-binding protein [Marinobacter sp. F4206]